MPTLRQVLPAAIPDAVQEQLGELLSAPVTAVKLATGSPCSGKQELFAPWPGEDPHVRQWFVLANGKAVGVNEDPSGDWSCPVVTL